jgi:hypothetical protein
VRDVHRTASGDALAVPKAPRWTSVEALPLGPPPGPARPGTLSAEGGVAVADVGAGPYWLALTAPTPDATEYGPARSFFELSARTFDFGRLLNYRTDLQRLTKPTYLTFEAPLTRPWQASVDDEQGGPRVALDDGLYLYSRNASVSTLVDGYFVSTSAASASANAPATGATALAWTLDAQQAFYHYTRNREYVNLIDAAKGDDLLAVHLVAHPARSAATPPGDAAADPWRAYAYRAAEGVLRPAPFAMTDGGTTKLAGAFEALPQKTFDLDLKGEAFQSAAADAPAGANTSSLAFSLSHEALANELSDGAWLSLLEFGLTQYRTYVDPVCNPDHPDRCEDAAACPAGCNGEMAPAPPPFGDHARQYAYGNPLAGGREVVTATSDFTYKLPASADAGVVTRTVIARVNVSAPADELDGKPLAPKLGLPRGVALNGQPAPLDRLTAGVGATPAVTFEPPALGTPAFYRLRLFNTDGVAGPSDRPTQVLRLVAQFRTAGTSLTIPAGVLEPGKRYYLEVSAVDDGSNPETPFRRSLHAASGTTITGAFTP